MVNASHCDQGLKKGKANVHRINTFPLKNWLKTALDWFSRFTKNRPFEFENSVTKICKEN
jgi:hypothetical protein